ncbi:MAG TPA: MarR family transcriptional regulator [Hyphomicrobiales bacterium]|nr:MarR family transcriptional regulator [Hyphomicrobiales bacterium]
MAAARHAPVTAPAAPPALALIELLFFAYRDFVGDADEVLQRYGFGRAHHRVLHFVNRNPGMTVAELLAVLKITKQSLGRVLRDLVEQGFIDARAGTRDRRQRLLHVTERGRGLARELMALQAARIERALAETGPEGAEIATAFLRAMVEPGDRPLVARLVGLDGVAAGG